MRPNQRNLIVKGIVHNSWARDRKSKLCKWWESLSKQLTVCCQHDFHERLVRDFWRGGNHLENVVGIVIVAEEQETVSEMIHAIVWHLKSGWKKDNFESRALWRNPKSLLDLNSFLMSLTISFLFIYSTILFATVKCLFRCHVKVLRTEHFVSSWAFKVSRQTAWFGKNQIFRAWAFVTLQNDGLGKSWWQ